MSCGLGAVALIFLLIKHNVDKPDDSVDSNINMRPKLDKLIDEEAELLDEQKKLFGIVKKLEPMA